nr:chaperone protein DnaJ 49 [Tanacetum cinerariifolium]
MMKNLKLLRWSKAQTGAAKVGKTIWVQNSDLKLNLGSHFVFKIQRTGMLKESDLFMLSKRCWFNTDVNFDADEIFRFFFGQSDMFRQAHVYRTRRAAGQQARENNGGTGPNMMLLLQLLPFLTNRVACLSFVFGD